MSQRADVVHDASELRDLKVAFLYFGPSFTCVLSGAGGLQVPLEDSAGYFVCLAPRAEVSVVSDHLLAALEASTFWDEERCRKAQADGGREALYRAWILEMFERFPAFKESKSRMFRGLASLFVYRRGQTVTLVPRRRHRGDSYGFVPDPAGGTLHFTLDVSSGAFDFASALSQAMSKCEV